MPGCSMASPPRPVAPAPCSSTGGRDRMAGSADTMAPGIPCIASRAMGGTRAGRPTDEILSWTPDDLVVVKLADLAIAEPQDAGQDFVRMLAQGRRDARRLALEGAELEGRSSHRITADAGLVEHGEHRVVEHVGLVGRKLAEGLVGRPQGAGLL